MWFVLFLFVVLSCLGGLPFSDLSIMLSSVSSTSLKGCRTKPAADMDKNHPKSKS